MTNKNIANDKNNQTKCFVLQQTSYICAKKTMSMGVNVYKYLVNPFSIVEIVDSGTHKSHGPNDPDTVTLYFSRDKFKELEIFGKMFLYDDVLFTIPGDEKVYYMLDYSSFRASVYSITLEVTDIDFSSAKSLREICSREEYDNFH